MLNRWPIATFELFIRLQDNTANTGALYSFTPARGGVGCTVSGPCNFTGPALNSGHNYVWIAAVQTAAAQGPWSTALFFTAQ
jgi:hypothetical protein